MVFHPSIVLDKELSDAAVTDAVLHYSAGQLRLLAVARHHHQAVAVVVIIITGRNLDTRAPPTRELTVRTASNASTICLVPMA